jgi:hypothetical protein
MSELKERPFTVDDEDPTAVEVVYDYEKKIDYSELVDEYAGKAFSSLPNIKLKGSSQNWLNTQPHINAEPHRRAMERLKNMTSEEIFNTAVQAGIYTPNGKLTEYYRQPTDCLHIKCHECNGTGVKSDRTSCIHMISCRCNSCSPITM